VISSSIDMSMFIAILPEILLLVVGLTVFVLDLVLRDENKHVLGWVVAAGLSFAILISLLVAQPGSEGQLVWGNMIRFDWMGFVFKMMFLFAAAITALLTMDIDKLGRRGEFYLLMLASTLGMCLMASAADLIMLYLAIETTSIPLYVLAGFLKSDDKSAEAGFKYLLFGAMTSTIMLYGFSLLFGFTGVTNIYDIAAQFHTDSLPTTLVLGVLMIILVGFGFKISAVPFHFWAPDVYEGAPTPVAGFLSTASKAAGFAVLMRVLMAAFPDFAKDWFILVAILATVTMTLGNLLALTQKNIKRLLAYSSIAHAGYILIGVASAGVASASVLGASGAVFYLMVYLLTNLLAFGVVSAFGNATGSDEIASYAGLSRRSPGMALLLMVAFLSLAGMPPFGGFIVKFSVFLAAVESRMVWLAVVGVLNSIVGLYYYLTVLKVVYLYRSEDEDKPLVINRTHLIAFSVLTFGILLLGIVIAPWFGISNTAILAMIRN
jgi:NADH-quinone oxidoreductase subunit N